ncbi:MAG: hypothetical protein LBE58_14665, partial [Comamonas sp.]|nr:hypothetical protein [Comamonas sp.]
MPIAVRLSAFNAISVRMGEVQMPISRITKCKPTVLCQSLMVALSMMCAAQVQAAPNYWVGPGQITDDTAWSFGVANG